jgi:hypothetical protein
VSPAEHDRETGLDVTGTTGRESLEELGFDLRAALLWDLQQVAACDGLVLLTGWETSSGVRAELALAAALGMWVIEDAFGGEPIQAATMIAATPRTGEVRVTNPDTGGQKGSKPARFDLIPPRPLWLLAEHYGKGAAKYADRNWERGTAWSLNFAALQRHAWAFWSGETTDPETGSPSMIAVAWHAMALVEFAQTHPELDDRPTRGTV